MLYPTYAIAVIIKDTNYFPPWYELLHFALMLRIYKPEPSSSSAVYPSPVTNRRTPSLCLFHPHRVYYHLICKVAGPCYQLGGIACTQYRLISSQCWGSACLCGACAEMRNVDNHNHTILMAYHHYQHHTNDLYLRFSCMSFSSVGVLFGMGSGYNMLVT